MKAKDAMCPFDLAQFRQKKSEVAGLPDLHALERVEDKALWCLCFSKDKVGVEYLSPAEISVILADVFEISAGEDAIRKALTRAAGKVHSRQVAHVTKFSIMKPGRESVSAAVKNRVLVVDPTQALAAVRGLEDLFGQFSGVAKICDPYLDSKTLQVLEMIPDACTIRFLSTPPRQGAAFTRAYAGYRAQHDNIEIRTIPPGKLHDRYVIVGQEMWLIGHSLNAIGTKQTFVVKLDGGIRDQIDPWFESTWRTAQILN